MNAKDLRRLRALHAMLGSDNEKEALSARKKILAILKRRNKTWNDLPEFLESTPKPSVDPRDAEPAPPTEGGVTVLDLVRAMLTDYVGLEPHEYTAVALWVIHTHIFDRYMVTPRLLLTSPVRSCGKTTLLDVCKHMVAQPRKIDSITAAGVYHLVDWGCTLLVDEADNLEIAGTLKAILNGGHRKGGARIIVIKGAPREFSLFGPIAFGAIGILPLPTMSRSIVIRMERRDATDLKRFDVNDTVDLDTVYRHTSAWAKEVKLDPDPVMPHGIHGRLADNWRPLLAIADACSRAWGVQARAAALVFTRGYHDEDIAVILLQDIRAIFAAKRVDRLASEVLVAALNDLEDAPWSEWRGLHDDQQPRKLSQNTLAELLRPFSIRSKKMRTGPDTKPLRGYERSDFEAAWKAYCQKTGTPEQDGNVRYLRGDQGGT